MKPAIVTAVLLIVTLALAGCANGVARYSAEPVLLDGVPVCCKVEVANGKEIGHLKLHMERRDGYWVLDLEETNVYAFRGQEIAAEVTRTSVSTVGTVAAAVMLAPAAASIGTAAIGALAQ